MTRRRRRAARQQRRERTGPIYVQIIGLAFVLIMIFLLRDQIVNHASDFFAGSEDVRLQTPEDPSAGQEGSTLMEEEELERLLRPVSESIMQDNVDETSQVD